MHRLHTLSPELSMTFERADNVTQADALRMACARAFSSNNLTGTQIDNAMAQLQAGGHSTELSVMLAGLSQHFDEQYFALSEAGNGQLSSKATRLFQQAPAAAALAFAPSSDQAAKQEALYEAVSAMSDQEELIAALLQKL